MFLVDMARESTFAFPKIPIYPGTHKEIEKNLYLSYKRKVQIFKMIGKDLEQKGVPVIAKKLVWESEIIKYLTDVRDLMHIRAFKIAGHSAVKGETYGERLAQDWIRSSGK